MIQMAILHIVANNKVMCNKHKNPSKTKWLDNYKQTISR